jgi:alkanesulfonate monooxygenase SsuD/methylene tetrahydromethanopterin reductase-like flavin-dependent oxidoreductase (luciferase family)
MIPISISIEGWFGLGWPQWKRLVALDQLLQQAGRAPGDVWRSVTIPIFCGRSDAELERRVSGFRRWGGLASMTLDQVLGIARADLSAITGTPQEAATQLRAYIAAGVDELVIQWPAADDVEGLQIIAEEVLPLLHSIA